MIDIQSCSVNKIEASLVCKYMVILKIPQRFLTPVVENLVVLFCLEKPFDPVG